MEINKKNRSELKKYFLANMIPLEGHFAALIDAGINQAEDGIAKLPGSPLSLQGEGEPSGTLDVLHLYQTFEDEAPSWMLNLNPEINPNEPEGSQRGLNIKDGNGMSRFFLKENNGYLGLGTITPRAKLDVREGTIYAGRTDQVAGTDTRVKLLLNHTTASNDTGHSHGVIGWVGTARDMSTNLSASISAGSNSWDDQGYLSFATSDGADQPKERIRITETGQVGIGTAKPQHKFEVLGDHDVALFQSTRETMYLRLANNEGFDNRVEFANRKGGRAAIWVAKAGDALNVTKEGKVGIGLSNPSEKLEVSGTVKATRFIGDGSGLTNLSGGEAMLHLALERDEKVGIGTNSPTQKLEVTGGNATINDLFIGDVGHGAHWAGLSHSSVIGPDSYGFLQSADGLHTLMNKKSGGGHLGFRIDNSDKMVLLDNGNVGIGTTKPIHKFEVLGDRDVALFQSTRDTMYLRLTNNEGMENRVEFANRKGGRAAIWVAKAGDALTVTKYGKVGIGLVDPSEQLEVSGSVKATKFIGDGSGLTNLSGGETKLQLALEQDEKVGIGTTTPTKKLDVKGDVLIEGSDSSGENACLTLKAGSQTMLIDGNEIDAQDTPLYLNMNSNRNVIIGAENSGGANMGLGTYNPSEKLEVVGSVKATRFIGDGSGLTNLGSSEAKLNMALLGDEKVGIGTESPKHKLEVLGDREVALFQSTTDSMYLRLANNEGMGNRVEFANRKGGKAAIWVADAGDALTVTKNGNVGIGTADPRHKFEVHGDNPVVLFQSDEDSMYLRLANKEGLKSRVEFANRPGGTAAIWVPDARYVFNITRDGKVGIGTDTPEARLQLINDEQRSDGNTLILGPKDKSNLRLGYHDNYSWIQSHGSKPLRINELGNDTIVNLDGGNVGIGKTQPSERLEVAGTVKAIKFIGDGSGLTNLGGGEAELNMALNQDEKVGIGTSSPKTKLDIRNGAIYAGDADNISGELAGLKLLLNNTTESHDHGHIHGMIGWIGAGRDMSGNLSAGIWSGSETWDDQGYLVFATSSGNHHPDERMRITEKGDVGIGTDKPQAKLQLINSEQDPNGNTLILGPTDKSNLRMGYHDNYSWIQSHGNKPLRINELGNDTLLNLRGGKVGIMTDSPQAPLSIQGDGKETNPDSSMHLTNDCILFGGKNAGKELNSAQISAGKHEPNSLNIVGMSSDNKPITRKVHVWAEAGMMVNGVVTAHDFRKHSDRRIKKDVRVSDHKKDLATLMKIQISDYHYIDQDKYDGLLQKKIIAQQVKEVFPMAVADQTTEVVPDVFKDAMIDDGVVTLPDHGLHVGEKVKLTLDELDEGGEVPVNELYEVLEVGVDTFKVNSSASGKVFVYGREVHDFCTVDMDALAMLNISATQALHHQIELLARDHQDLIEKYHELAQLTIGSE